MVGRQWGGEGEAEGFRGRVHKAPSDRGSSIVSEGRGVVVKRAVGSPLSSPFPSPLLPATIFPISCPTSPNNEKQL